MKRRDLVRKIEEGAPFLFGTVESMTGIKIPSPRYRSLCLATRK
jgi:hypothetical protein